MGLRIDPNKIILTGANNEIKFTTDRKIPHIIGTVAGYISHYVTINDGGWQLQDTNEIVAGNEVLKTGEVFSLNFIKLVGSRGDTGGKYITANGSITANIYSNQNGDFKGSTVITSGPFGNGNASVYINIRTAVNGWDGTLSGGSALGFTIYYRIFYGRF